MVIPPHTHQPDEFVYVLSGKINTGGRLCRQGLSCRRKSFSYCDRSVTRSTTGPVNFSSGLRFTIRDNGRGCSIRLSETGRTSGGREAGRRNKLAERPMNRWISKGKT